MMLTYGQVLEIGNKGERLHIFEFAYPVVIEGHLALRADGRHISVPELEAMAQLQPIIAEIRKREDQNAERR